MSGFADLASVLTGGLDPTRQDAFFKGQQQRGQLEHLSAQTQGALETAKLQQMKAKQAQIELDEGDKLADALLATHAAKTPEEARAAATVIRGGFANYDSYAGGQNKIQEHGFREEVANTGLPEEARLGASSGIKGTVQASPDGQTPAITNFRYAEGIEDPAKRERFNASATPEKVFMAGGVPYANTKNPRQLVSTEEAATNAGATAGAKTTAQGAAKIALDQPAAKARLDSASFRIDKMASAAELIKNSPDLQKAVGIGKPLGQIWGTGGRKVRADIAALKSKIALGTLLELRQASKTGGALGNVSDKDIELLQNSIAGLDEGQSAEDFIDQLQLVVDYAGELKERMHSGYDAQYTKQTAVPNSAPAALSFASEAEAEAAGLKPGTRVTIGGQSGTWH